jgi:hypothetical protein
MRLQIRHEEREDSLGMGATAPARRIRVEG